MYVLGYRLRDDSSGFTVCVLGFGVKLSWEQPENA